MTDGLKVSVRNLLKDISTHWKWQAKEFLLQTTNDESRKHLQGMSLPIKVLENGHLFVFDYIIGNMLVYAVQINQKVITLTKFWSIDYQAGRTN